MQTLGFDGFLDGIATVIAEHLVPEEGPAMTHPVTAAITATAQPTAALLPAHSFILDHEKIVWHYPDTASRIFEDPR